MAARRPFVTDPAHLDQLTGRASLCARPSGEVEEAFERAQAQVREIVGDEGASWPAAHMTLAGFGTRDRPVDEPMQRSIAALVDRCTSAISPLRLEVTGFDAFVQDRVPILAIRSTPELSAAARRIRSGAVTQGLPSHEEIPVDDWVFHLSLGYYAGERLDRVASELRQIATPPAACVVHELELVAFSGGPERLVATIPLTGPR